MLLEKIQEDMKHAMLNREQEKVTTLRSLISELKKWKVDNPRKEYNEEVEMTVLRKCLKQRKDSIESYESAGRQDLADPEKVESTIIETYLPKLMNEEEVFKIVISKKEELGISDKSGIGKLMGAVMQELKGKADGTIVKSMVEKSLG